MHSNINILAVDDDSVSRKLIGRALSDDGFEIDFAVNGQEGLNKAMGNIPHIIILDVEMPDINGYQVCQQLRADDKTREIPVVFLSSGAGLKERLLGYNAGGHDYLIKPFVKEDLIAKIKVLSRFRIDQEKLKTEYAQAQQTAMIALTGSSELGVAMKFTEKSYSFRQPTEVADGLLNLCRQFQLDCVVKISKDGTDPVYVSSQAVTPLEKEMIDMVDHSQRIVDLDERTIINFSNLSVLIKNMPLDDPDRYGRMKDLLPMVMASAEAKLNSLVAESELSEQSEDLMQAFTDIRSRLYFLAKTLISKQDEGALVLNRMVTEINIDLLRMGLEDDQEALVLSTLEFSIDEVIGQIDSTDVLYQVFSSILANLKSITAKQQMLQNSFATKNESNYSEIVPDDGIEMF
ncbi:MAG: CheY-like chemotaxis protein [Gammaproteobacteria bacterium]|jgi:CheY-like chemotaxis protein